MKVRAHTDESASSHHRVPWETTWQGRGRFLRTTAIFEAMLWQKFVFCAKGGHFFGRYFLAIKPDDFGAVF